MGGSGGSHRGRMVSSRGKKKRRDKMSMCEGGRGVAAAGGHCTRPEGQRETTWCQSQGEECVTRKNK